MTDSILTTGRAVREACRDGHWTGPTAGLAKGFVQANLVVLPADDAADFQLFCDRNPRACPLLEVTAAGDWQPRQLAPGADLRVDLPRYRVWRDGHLEDEPLNVAQLWRADLVSFLIGCSFTFEAALERAGLPLRHLEQGRNVSMYRTSRDCVPAGRFAGPLVVSMRPMTPAQAGLASEICARFPLAHGAPLAEHNPAELGIGDLAAPDFGDPVDIRDGEIPVFWACGVTPQSALLAARPSLAMTHAPGCMFVSDQQIHC